MKPNISSVVDNNENLFRAIKILPQLWDDEFNRPSSAAFKDSKGLSVDRNAERSFDEVITCLKKHFSNLKGVAYFTASSCKNIGLIILYCPTPDETDEQGNPSYVTQTQPIVSVIHSKG